MIREESSFIHYFPVCFILNANVLSVQEEARHELMMYGLQLSKLKHTCLIAGQLVQR